MLAFSKQNGFAYGLMGLPLAFVALPLYVILPNHYAKAFGVPLATLGAILLGARLFDAAIDPLLGRLSDRLFSRSIASVLAVGAASAVVLADRDAHDFAIAGIADALLVECGDVDERITAGDIRVDVRIFGKPSTRPYRRMAVALATGATTDDARAVAVAAAGKVRIVYAPGADDS